MKFTCPACGAVASADAWGNDRAARDLFQTVANLPAPLPPIALGYLSLFRPAKSALSWRKAGRVATELADLVGTGSVQIPGKAARPCPARIWARAIEKMQEQRDSIRRPLDGHNYLKKVAWSLADQEDAQREQQTRENEQNGSHRVRTGPAQDESESSSLSPIMQRYLDKYGHLPGEQPGQNKGDE